MAGPGSFHFTEGYHEQERYDPSDWFEIGRDIDYEDDYYGGYYNAF